MKLLTGDVLAQNQPMLEMVKRLGFVLKKDTEGGTFRVEMALQEGGPGLASATETADG